MPDLECKIGNEKMGTEEVMALVIITLRFGLLELCHTFSSSMCILRIADKFNPFVVVDWIFCK